MRLEVSGIDHQVVRVAALRGQLQEDAVEHPQSTPADEAVVDGLVRTVARRQIAPAKAVPDDKQDAAKHPPVVHPRYPVREWKVRLNPAHLRRRQHQQITQGSTSCHLESSNIDQLNKLMGPDPSYSPPFLIRDSDKQLHLTTMIAFQSQGNPNWRAIARN